MNKAYCGNNIREGVEVCDGDGEDKCPEFGAAINMTLTCNKKTCGCDINQTIPSDYNPQVVEGLINASQTASSCGDKKVERVEDCDPPNTLCTTSTNDPGICNEKCKCVLPEMYGVEEEPSAVNETVKDNETLEENKTVGSVSVNMTAENLTEAPENVTEKIEEEKPGIFARFWAWIVALFS